MIRLHLTDNVLNTKIDINKKKYNNQLIIISSLTRRKKNSCFRDVNRRDVTGNKTFWEIVKHFFRDKMQLNLK